MKTLLVDNYDSFTYNLYQLIAGVNGEPPVVIRNDQFNWEALQRSAFDSIVLSPGPGSPSQPVDFGVCKDIIQKAEIPILGVCLGFQGIAEISGGIIAPADTVMHGRVSRVTHNNDPLFNNIPQNFNVVRYHSLHVAQLPENMEALAWENQSQVLMAAKHRIKPQWGVQFHPESICTEYGKELIQNFFILAGRSIKTTERVKTCNNHSILKEKLFSQRKTPKGEITQEYQVHFQKCTTDLDSAALFYKLYEDTQNTYWLDSALVQGETRFSFMGDTSGPLAETITFFRNDATPEGGIVKIKRHSNYTEEYKTPFFNFLNNSLLNKKIKNTDKLDCLPFDFVGGYIGYLGYGLKNECGYDNLPVAAIDQGQDQEPPDACFHFVDRFIVFDHTNSAIYLVALSDSTATEKTCRSWLREMENRLQVINTDHSGVLRDSVNTSQYRGVDTRLPLESLLHSYTAVHSDKEYIQKIQQIQKEIKRGETYEACLTNRLQTSVTQPPIDVYRYLREVNPAPYACFFQVEDLAVLCASPEKFLTIDRNGNVVTKPIKGTRPRGRSKAEDQYLREDLAANEKDRSENLMIVDLLRNDLGRVAKIGSVGVEKLFNVESYASVHQLVSTVVAQLEKGVSVVDCVKACFPGGSMTGAPKKRTLEILDKLEGNPRGVYSGAMGYFSLNGCVDLNIVIRTIIINKTCASIGVGGAIVDLSDPDGELEETRVKARALLHALSQVTAPN